MELWGEAHTSCRLGGQPCRAVPVEEARPGAEAGSFGPTSLRAMSHFILWIRQETQPDPVGRIRARGWQRSILNEFVSWSLHLAGWWHPFGKCWWISHANSPGLHCGVLFMLFAHRWCCWTRVFPQPVFFWKHWHSLSLPSHWTDKFQHPPSPALQCAGVAPGWWVHSLSPCPLGSPLIWHEHGQVTLLWLEQLLTSPWVWALILAWNFILTELIPDCFSLQKLVSDKAVFNKDIRGKELWWLDRALPCWALLCPTRKRRFPSPSAFHSCSLAAWWSRRHSRGGVWYLFLPNKKTATKYLHTVGWKKHTEPE